ncbi:MAG: hypothetical protein NTX45_21270 [Proteobacteria bacterium]|nr:hypothetical protein [Pseudomonadota bacterium]
MAALQPTNTTFAKTRKGKSSEKPIMLLIDFDKTDRDAFARGFLKGLGAPYVLFGKFEYGTIPEIRIVSPIFTDINDSISSDWRNVGTDIRNAIELYGQKHSASQ